MMVQTHEPFLQEIKLNADDSATPTYSSELFSFTKADGTTRIGQQQGDIITIPNGGLNNQDWIGTITKVLKLKVKLTLHNNFSIKSGK